MTHFCLLSPPRVSRIIWMIPYHRVCQGVWCSTYPGKMWSYWVQWVQANFRYYPKNVAYFKSVQNRPEKVTQFEGLLFGQKRYVYPYPWSRKSWSKGHFCQLEKVSYVKTRLLLAQSKLFIIYKCTLSIVSWFQLFFLSVRGMNLQ